MSAESNPMSSAELVMSLRRGLVIPAHPLALTKERRLDERRQRALSRYYLAAGAGGLAVGVHTTEFKIHDPAVGLYGPVLELAMAAAREAAARGAAPGSRDARGSGAATLGSSAGPGGPGPIMIAGVIGDTAQAVREAETARGLGYHLGLLGLGALRDADEPRLLEHARAVAKVIPLMGFYLQPAVGGRVLAESFWRHLAEIPNLAAIKIAPFNRYYTLAVVRAVAESGRAGEVALYTGNDDSILVDLLTEYRVETERGPVNLPIAGGLLGHWAYWTRCAVEQLAACHEARGRGLVSAELLTLAAQVTESNEAVFDPEHSFRGCISGILYVLARSGLLSGVYPIGDGEELSRGQAEKIDRVMARYPHLTDQEFVREYLEHWLAP